MPEAGLFPVDVNLKVANYLGGLFLDSIFGNGNVKF